MITQRTNVMETPEDWARNLFGQRASYYATSETHTDPQVLARVVSMAAPGPDWGDLDVASGTGHTAFALPPPRGVGDRRGLDAGDAGRSGTSARRALDNER